MKQESVSGPGKYRVKVAIIEAMRFTSQNYAQINNWVTQTDYYTQVHKENDKQILTISNEMEYMHAEEGDWVLLGVTGEFFICTDEFFQETYVALDYQTGFTPMIRNYE